MASINLSEGRIALAAANVGQVVRVQGPTKGGGADMVGYLAGVTYTQTNIIVIMEHGQTTTFLREGDNEDVTLEVLPQPDNN